MRRLTVLLVMLAAAIFTLATTATADFLDDIKKKYSATRYIVGAAEVESSGNDYRDRRRTSIMARLEIARQIKVRISETTLDYMCEGQGKSVFKEGAECKDQFIMIIEESVDEILEGTRVVEEGKDDERGVYYAVVVLPRKNIIDSATDGYNDSLEKAKEYIDKAKESGDTEEKKANAEKAKEELRRGVAFEGERKAFEDSKEHSTELFDELAGELDELEEEW